MSDSTPATEDAEMRRFAAATRPPHAIQPQVDVQARGGVESLIERDTPVPAPPAGSGGRGGAIGDDRDPGNRPEVQVQEFGAGIAIVSGAVLAALAFRRVAERTGIPAPAVFLVVSAAASTAVTPIRTALTPTDVSWIASGALMVILFDGGVSLGWRRVRRVLAPVAALGIGATLAAAGVMAVAAHAVLGFAWTPAAAVGVALAPTDPAVVFSVIRDGGLREEPRTILEAESGFNDPVAIALMVGVVAASTSGDSWLPTVGVTLARELALGVVVGLAGAWLASRVLRHLTEPRETLQPIVALSAAGLIFGTAAALHGSGFLAVFVAGLLLGDAEMTVGEDVRAFHGELAGLAEVIVFVSLGLTVHLAALGLHGVTDGLVLTAIMLTCARLPAAMLLLAPLGIPSGERLFLAWSGLRGAVPILLASLALIGHLPDGRQIYGLVFVVVAASVLVQGVTMPRLMARLGVDQNSVR
jgi:potassium/hydrogen antiporter